MQKQYKYYDIIMVAFAVVLVCTNLIGSRKITQINAPVVGTLTFGAIIFGEAVDSILFFPLAFYGSGEFPDAMLPKIIVAQFTAKVLVEVAFTPIMYKVVAFLKRTEAEDYYDNKTDFNPFRLNENPH